MEYWHCSFHCLTQAWIFSRIVHTGPPPHNIISILEAGQGLIYVVLENFLVCVNIRQQVIHHTSEFPQFRPSLRVPSQYWVHGRQTLEGVALQWQLFCKYLPHVMYAWETSSRNGFSSWKRSATLTILLLLSYKLCRSAESIINHSYCSTQFKVLTGCCGFASLNWLAFRPTYISLTGSSLLSNSMVDRVLGIRFRCSDLTKQARKLVKTWSCLSCSLWTSVWLPYKENNINILWTLWFNVKKNAHNKCILIHYEKA